VRVAFCIDWSVDAEREWGTGSLIRSSLITLIVVIPMVYQWMDKVIALCC
jgi:hypothetical protein